jgi:predicted nucleic acid-binding protein
LAYLIDTCIISQLIATKPSLTVIRWLESVPEENCFLSVLTIGELKKGVSKLNLTESKKVSIAKWLEEAVIERFSGRILPVSTEIALKWGELLADSEKKGKVVPAIDGLIAATAMCHALIVATRNVKDFSATKVSLFNPWN